MAFLCVYVTVEIFVVCITRYHCITYRSTASSVGNPDAESWGDVFCSGRRWVRHSDAVCSSGRGFISTFDAGIGKTPGEISSADAVTRWRKSLSVGLYMLSLALVGHSRRKCSLFPRVRLFRSANVDFHDFPPKLACSVGPEVGSERLGEVGCRGRGHCRVAPHPFLRGNWVLWICMPAGKVPAPRSGLAHSLSHSSYSTHSLLIYLLNKIH